MLPQGNHLTPGQLLAMVEGAENAQGVVYRRDGGCVYALGLKADRQLWRRCGYRYMGSIPFLLEQFKVAQRIGVRERSLVWYLLQDVERETQRAAE